MSDELELEGGRSWEQHWDTVKRRRWWLLRQFPVTTKHGHPVATVTLSALTATLDGM